MRAVEIIVAGTGQNLPKVGSFLGTVFQGPFVWHLFTGPGDELERAVNLHYLTTGNDDANSE